MINARGEINVVWQLDLNSYESMDRFLPKLLISNDGNSLKFYLYQHDHSYLE